MVILSELIYVTAKLNLLAEIIHEHLLTGVSVCSDEPHSGS